MNSNSLLLSFNGIIAISVALSILFISCEDKKTYFGKTVSEWITLLDDQDTKTREEAFNAITKIGPDAKKAVPKLLNIISNKDEQNSLRIQAINSISAIGKNAKKAKSTFKTLLSNIDEKDNLKLAVIDAYISTQPDTNSNLKEIFDALGDDNISMKHGFISYIYMQGYDTSMVLPILMTQYDHAVENGFERLRANIFLITLYIDSTKYKDEVNRLIGKAQEHLAKAKECVAEKNELLLYLAESSYENALKYKTDGEYFEFFVNIRYCSFLCEEFLFEQEKGGANVADHCKKDESSYLTIEYAEIENSLLEDDFDAAKSYLKTLDYSLTDYIHIMGEEPNLPELIRWCGSKTNPFAMLCWEFCLKAIKDENKSRRFIEAKSLPFMIGGEGYKINFDVETRKFQYCKKSKL